jgi:hypothetical protein
MAYFPGTYLLMAQGSTAKMSHFIDDLLTPRLLAFRQIHIDDEMCALRTDLVTWYVTYGNWLGNDPRITIRKNGQVATPATSDYVNGQFTMAAIDIGLDSMPRDVVEASYVFDYFPPAILEGFLLSAMSVINMTAVGPPTSYTIETAPTNWEGVITDLAYAMCMEKLLLDYDLWRYRLIFAIGPGEVYGSGGGDIAGQLTTLKQNAEERANRAMENPKFKTGNYISVPTSIYYASINGGFGGSLSGTWQGKLRGWKPNRFI